MHGPSSWIEIAEFRGRSTVFHRFQLKMADALAKKKKIRAGHKGSATKTVRQKTEELGDADPDCDRLSLDAEIVELVEDERGLADEIKQADKYKETLYECVLNVDQFLKATPPTPDAPTVLAVAPPMAPPADARINRVKLPKLQLCSFNGDLVK